MNSSSLDGINMTDSRSKAAKKAWATRRSATYKARKSEKASKEALRAWCKVNGWKVLFFEGDSGSPRTGIVDAIIARIMPNDADAVEVRFVQLKSGRGGLTATEIARMKRALKKVINDWMLVGFDGQAIHFLPEIQAHSK